TYCSRPPRRRFSLTPAAPPHISTLSLHDALPISSVAPDVVSRARQPPPGVGCAGRDCDAGGLKRRPRPHESPDSSSRRRRSPPRSEEHTSELQSRFDLVCRLLLEKKKSVDGADIA